MTDIIKNNYLYICIYFSVINLIAIGLTIYDKRAARLKSKRVRERTLLFASIIGGSITMLIVMRIIRHKTKHLKFMIGIPFIIILQITAILHYLHGV